MASDVPGLIADAKAYTAELVGDATDAMNRAISSAQNLVPFIPEYIPATPPAPPPKSLPTKLPTLAPVTLELPNAPEGDLVFQDISPIEAGIPPAFTDPAPTITLPNTPAQLAAFQNQLPSVNTSIVFPTPPDMLLNPLIDAPTFTEHDEPEKPQTIVPAFTSVAPIDTAVAPTNLSGQFADAYSSAAPSTVAMMDGYVDAMLTKRNPRFNEQMAAIEDQLAKYMAGGTALNPEIEDAIYSRARAKNDVEARRVIDSAAADAAARGFTLPTGTLVSTMARARQEAANNNAKTSTDIAVAQAEMEQKNLQFAVTTSVGLRTALLSATLSYHQNLITINGQALDYAKTVLNAVIETYNTAVKAFTVRMEAYKTDAAVYETRLKSAMAGIELYKAEVQALEAMTNVDKVKADVYRARIEVLTSLSTVYRAQIEAVQGRVNMEKLKIDLFQGQVQAYTALVQAKNSEWQGYSAAIQGQTAIAQVYATKVQGYAAQVQGYRTSVEAKAEVVRATVAANQGRAAQYTARLEGYKSVVSAKAEQARAEVESQRGVILAFQAQVQADIGAAQVAQGYYRAVADVAVQNAQGNLRGVISRAETQRSYGDNIARLGTANATIYANLASSAMAGMNTLAAETVAS